jgi:hypothetical protein
MKLATPIFRRLILVALAGAMALPSVAQARVFFGVGIPFYGPPAYYPPPVYYPPPAYYPPPPVIYAPPPATYTPPPTRYSSPNAAVGQSCQAGPYVCPMDRPSAPGSSCYCSGNGGQRVWGRTD